MIDMSLTITIWKLLMYLQGVNEFRWILGIFVLLQPLNGFWGAISCVSTIGIVMLSKTLPANKANLVYSFNT